VIAPCGGRCFLKQKALEHGPVRRTKKSERGEGETSYKDPERRGADCMTLKSKADGTGTFWEIGGCSEVTCWINLAENKKKAKQGELKGLRLS